MIAASPKALLAVVCLLPVLGIAGVAAYIYWKIYRSRPLLNGLLRFEGLQSSVTIQRDAAGIPTLSGVSERDVAFGLGFVHAQERMFQIDLCRRAAAGEMSELLGDSYLRSDRRARRHQFRKRTEALYASLSLEERLTLLAYTSGITAGLGSLKEPPVEYFLLRSRPREWSPQDTLLLVCYMYLLLQDEGGDQDFNRYLLYHSLPESVARFLSPEGSARWDAPLTGANSDGLTIPSPTDLDLRTMVIDRIKDLHLRSTPTSGSNAWAVSGRCTSDGRAIVANDMHLPFAMPPVFFRAVLEVGDLRRSGLTLPGFPFLVAGTNGKIAWGLANSAIDSVDLVQLDQTGLSPDQYRSPDGVRDLVPEQETIRVRGSADVHLTVKSTVWGPVARRALDGTLFAQSWLAYRNNAINLSWQALEHASSVAEAIEGANRIGTPTLAFVLADCHGDVGWTVGGPLPHRGKAERWLPTPSAVMRQPRSAEDRDITYPSLRSPEIDRIWAANARPFLTGEFGDLLSGGYHSFGARSSQIRDRLADLPVADETAMLQLQLDDRAKLLERWRPIFVASLEISRASNHTRVREVQVHLAKWDGKASADSIAYRLLREFHDAVEELVFEPFISIVRARQGGLDYRSVTDHQEEPLWALITERPLHLLAPWFADWDALLESAANKTIDCIPKRAPLETYTWGDRNRLDMTHVLSRSIPFVGRFFDAQRAKLNGDLNMPLAQTSKHGPAFRFVISPGHEENALMQMAGGQAGNPLAPYYLAGHDDWLLGRSSPYAPGSTRSTLTLEPLQEAAARPLA